MKQVRPYRAGWRRVFLLAAFLGGLSLAAASTSAEPQNESTRLMVRFAPIQEFGLAAEQALAKLTGSVTDPEAAQLQTLAAYPVHAKFLITTRLSPEHRQPLPRDHPTEALHQWLVLEYPTIDSARVALDVIKRQPNVFRSAGLAGKGTFTALPSQSLDPQYYWSNVIPNTSFTIPSPHAVHAFVGLPGAWDWVPGFANVAVIDGGIQTSHLDFVGNLRQHLSKDVTGTGGGAEEPGFRAAADLPLSYGHGTHVSGIIAARPGNGGTVGACWYCSLIMMRITPTPVGSNPNFYDCPGIADALNEATLSGAQVINMSLGASNACRVPDADQAAFIDAVAQAHARGVAVVASIGNIQNLINNQLMAPSSYPGAIAVNATTTTGSATTFSPNLLSHSGKIDFAAPGLRIFSTFYSTPSTAGHWAGDLTDVGHPGTGCTSLHQYPDPLRNYGYCSGTSMATPLISGVVAIMKSANPLLSMQEIVDVLAARATDPAGAGAHRVGMGIPNAEASVKDVLNGRGALNNRPAVVGNLGMTPLFVLTKTSGTPKHLYTVVPQVAKTASLAQLPRDTATYGPVPDNEATLSSYTVPPGPPGMAVKARFRVFTTSNRFGVQLQPLYRLSKWSGERGYAVGSVDLAGFDVDGIEGYLYPANIAQPSGTVAVLRKYNSAIQDYVLIDPSQESLSQFVGYSGSVVGYACPVSGGTGVCASSPAAGADLTVSQCVQLKAFEMAEWYNPCYSSHPNNATALTNHDVVFNVTVTNNGPTATTATVTSDFNATAAFSYVPWVSGCSAGAGQTVICTAENLASGSSRTFKVVMRKGTAGVVQNIVTVSSITADPNTGNNTSVLTATATTSPTPNHLIRYRLRPPGPNPVHLYTIDSNERNALVAANWVDETPTSSPPRLLDHPGAFNGVQAVPYYRLYNNQTGARLWTTDVNEYYTLAQFPQWVGESSDGFILPSQAAGSIPLYRLLRPDGYHFWTTDAHERSVLISAHGWGNEGVAGYMIQ